MYCNNCGKSIRDNAVFCKYCGSRVNIGKGDTDAFSHRKRIQHKNEDIIHNAHRIKSPTIIFKNKTDHIATKTKKKYGCRSSILYIIKICVVALVVLMVAAFITGRRRATSGLKGAKIGDIVTFGEYEQDNNTGNGKEPIEWIVLDKNGGELLLISKYILDGLPYNDLLKESVTWENCTLRLWLNKVFYKEAFSQSEQLQIKETTLPNNDNAFFGTSGGIITHDQLFLLSINDIAKYFDISIDDEDGDVFRESLITETTEYAKSKGVPTHKITGVELEFTYLKDVGFSQNAIGSEGGFWWLRSPGIDEQCAALIGDVGFLDDSGMSVDSMAGIRPALYITLNTSRPPSHTGVLNESNGNNLGNDTTLHIGETETPTEEIIEQFDNQSIDNTLAIDLKYNSYYYSYENYEGYNIKATLTISDWIKATEHNTIVQEWSKIGGKGNPPTLSEFDAVKWGRVWNFYDDTAAVLFGTISFQNETPGYDATVDHPTEGRMVMDFIFDDISIPHNGSPIWPIMLIEFSDKREFRHAYRNSNVYQNRLPTDIAAKLTSNNWGPVPFMIAANDVFGPKYPNGNESLDHIVVNIFPKNGSVSTGSFQYNISSLGDSFVSFELNRTW